jgi:hypothetical protein
MNITNSEKILDLAAKLPIEQLPDLVESIADMYCKHHLTVFVIGRGGPSMYMHEFLRVLWAMKPGTRAAQCIAFCCAAMAMAGDTIDPAQEIGDEGYAPNPKLKRQLPKIRRIEQALAQLSDPAHLG